MKPAQGVLIRAPLQDNADEFEKLDLQRVGVLVGTGMGGLQVFQDGVQNLVERGYKKISPFFIPYAITNMCAGLACKLRSQDKLNSQSVALSTHGGSTA